MRRLARFIADVAMVVGVLLVIEASITALWQEPLTSLIAARAQAGLSDDLDALEQRSAAEAAASGGPSKHLIAAHLARLQDRRTETGDAIGRIELPTLDRDYTMVEGTGADSLAKGPGHYSDTPLPGQRGTFAVAGHRTTYLAPFRYIDQLEHGDRVVADMPYGRFVYKVEQTRVVQPTEVWVKGSVDHDRIVLTACHPPFSAAQRIVAFASLERYSVKGQGAKQAARRVD